MEYLRICEGSFEGKPTKGFLIPRDESPSDYVKNWDKAYFLSTFIYNEDHFQTYLKEKTISGITDVTTDKIYWDFDSKNDLESAQRDAQEICARLLRHGIPQDNLLICFSGSKGFGVEVITDKRFTPTEVQSICMKMGEGLTTLDKSMYNASRVFRIPTTKHPATGLYKFPLSLEQLSDLSTAQIKELAKDREGYTINPEVFDQVISIPDSIIELKKVEKIAPTIKPSVSEAINLDFVHKPKGFTNCKFAIMNGFIPEGNSNNCLMALSATCRAQGYPKDITYNICKAALRLRDQIYGTGKFDKRELWSKVIEVVYGPNWNGAQYSCKTAPWLKDICDSLGNHSCDHTKIKEGFIEMDHISSEFENYSLNIDKNTIKTGLTDLDNNIQLTIGMPVGLLGAPSSGKTSLALNILNNTSKAGISSVFFSMDMYGPLVYMKQIQKLEGLSNAEIHHIFKHDPKKAAEIKEKLREEYKNVKFSLKSGHTVEEMRNIVNDYQENTGDKVKLVVIDYLECIAGPYADPTANGARIAGELRDFATEMAVCGVTLIQPPKVAGDASAKLTSMRQIKGSSMLEQSFRAVLGIYRDGFGPEFAEDDKFLTINALKNTMGPLFSIDYRWEGRRGEISSITDEGKVELAELRKRKDAKKELDPLYG